MKYFGEFENFFGEFSMKFEDFRKKISTKTSSPRCDAFVVFVDFVIVLDTAVKAARNYFKVETLRKQTATEQGRLFGW